MKIRTLSIDPNADEKLDEVSTTYFWSCTEVDLF